MTARDRIAAIVLPTLPETVNFPQRLSERIANALIAAGVTMPDRCGATAIICGIEYECDLPTHTKTVAHYCIDSVGVMHWRDSDNGPIFAGAYTPPPDSDDWPIGQVTA